MILGTAGHIDHGKTTLVRALTGVDTDRLPEEKRRGITIELGFAPLVLPELGTVGVVDVPGHEAFVRTMVAGAAGIDVALLVIAADEGVMPQTREHLAILSLLGVSLGVVALTKRELVDPDWLALVEDDVRATLAASPLADAPIIAVSALTGQGMPELREALREMLCAVPARRSDADFRLPIDRAFTVKGTGSVVTGTVWSGALERDASVRILPGGEQLRVRGLHAHGSAVPRVEAGDRAALALANIDVAALDRGAVVVQGSAWRATRVLRADIALLPDCDVELGPRTRVRLHLGTSEVGARLVVRDVALVGGAHVPARLVLDAPIVARAGDRFVIRSASPVATLGGGIVTDPHAPVRARPWPGVGLTSLERLDLLTREGGANGVLVGDLPVRVGVARGDIDALILGLRLAAPHTNARGFAHGGLIAALTDKAMGHSCGYKMRNLATSLVTVSMAIDFISSAQIGQWLTVETDVIKTGSTICFAQCFVKADDVVIARANATFRVVPRK